MWRAWSKLKKDSCLLIRYFYPLLAYNPEEGQKLDRLRNPTKLYSFCLSYEYSKLFVRPLYNRLYIQPTIRVFTLYNPLYNRCATGCTTGCKVCADLNRLQRNMPLPLVPCCGRLLHIVSWIDQSTGKNRHTMWPVSNLIARSSK